jgi:hypothetical protein
MNWAAPQADAWRPRLRSGAARILCLDASFAGAQSITFAVDAQWQKSF